MQSEKSSEAETYSSITYVCIHSDYSLVVNLVKGQWVNTHPLPAWSYI